jgi:arylsulfatase A-like enzyme
VLFEQASTPAVFTLSAMASLWTSLPPLLHHAGAAYDDALPPGPATLAEILGARGVHTAGFIANSMAGPAFGLDRGFAEFDEVHLRLGHRGEAVTGVVRDWLRARSASAGRFFLYVHLREPHFPYDPPAPFDTLFGPDAPLGRRERSDPRWYGQVNDGEVQPTPAQVEHLRRLYDGNLAYADAQVGALRRALEETGLLERSVVIVTADHGEALFEHGWIGHNQQVFEPSTRVPLIVRFPGASPAGVRASGLVDLLDVAPTIADAFGLRDEARARGFRGRSLLDVALGAPGKDATYAVSTGELRAFGLRHGRFKYLRNIHFDGERLFDLEADPGESQELAARLAVRAGWYREELHAHVFELLRAARGPGARARLTPEQLENLKSLGYLN